MVSKYHLGKTDYIVICISLLLSACIGLASRFYGGKQRTAREYMLAGQNMPKLPVIFSIVVTLTSASTLISTPAESYKYGLGFTIFLATVPIGMFLASVVFIPVYFQCGVTTVNEFLEMRYGRMIRYILSVLFLVQMVLYMSFALFASVLSLSAVTDLSMEISIISLGAICVLYCSLGGLRAVLWVDVFQACLMMVCILSIYIVGIRDTGGVPNIYKNAKEGQRLEMFHFQIDFTKRFGFWGCFFRGLVYGIGLYGTNQVEVQRMLSLSTAKRAKSVLRLSAIPVTLMYFICFLFGLVLYSVHYNCDPILNKAQTGISSYDQMVPAYIVQKFSSIPGMTGLCVAGIFSASLSTISSALNSASTVTVVDFLKIIFVRKGISDIKTVWLAKALSIVYGIVCISLSFCFLSASSLQQLYFTLVGLADGPMLAVFLTGVLTRKASDKCVSVAVVLTYILMVCLGIGSLLARYSEPPLPVSISNCPNPNISRSLNYSSPSCLDGDDCSSSLLPTHSPIKDIFILFKVSYMWYAPLGFTLTMIFITLFVLVTGFKKNVIPANSKCLSPVTRFWMKTSHQTESEFMKNTTEQDECTLPLSQHT